MIKINAVQNTSLYDIHVLDDQGNFLFHVKAGRILCPEKPLRVGEGGFPHVALQYQEAPLSDWKVSVSEPDLVNIQANGEQPIICAKAGSVKLRVSYYALSLYEFEHRKAE